MAKPINQFPYTLLNELINLQKKPPEFAPGEAHFWTDPHIARQMLRFHLDPDTDAASRKLETIRHSVEWIIQTLKLSPGNHLIDLGCGPGLYTAGFARHGILATGIDFSQNSIDYAIQTAQSENLRINYRCQDYLQLEDKALYEVALLIYGDFCPLSPEKRKRLMANIHRALKPGGYFVLDVTTPALRKKYGLKNGWYAAESGFWKAGPHLVLEQGFAYEGDLYLDQYIVIEQDGKISVYRNWFQDYSAESIRHELEENGFMIESLWSDLVGTPLQAESDWIGIIAQRN